MNDLQRKTGINAPRRGLSAVEVIVVLVIVVLFALFVVMMLPRRREAARMAGCQLHLMQIGIGLALYDQTQGYVPFVPGLGVEGGDRGIGPLKALLVELGRPDLSALTDVKTRPAKLPNLTHEERRVPGFVCPSDTLPIDSRFPAPVSYRATTGDAPDGRNGPFAPGRHIGIGHVEATDGGSYTAAFAERLIGDAQAKAKQIPHPARFNYALVPGPIPKTGCSDAAYLAWRDDAGMSWAECTWRSTLYNHAPTPNAEPSCIDAQGRSAFMGASSGHVEGVNVLFFDGSVRTFTPQVDPKVWREWATVPQAPRDTLKGESR